MSSPGSKRVGIMDLEKWNDPGLWIDYYDDALGAVSLRDEDTRRPLWYSGQRSCGSTRIPASRESMT